MLMESYEQSKRTPAYRELRSKYRALKKSHKEILSALTALAQGISLANEDAPRKSRKSKSRKSKSRRDSDTRTPENYSCSDANNQQRCTFILTEMEDDDCCCEISDEPINAIVDLSTGEDLSSHEPGILTGANLERRACAFRRAGVATLTGEDLSSQVNEHIQVVNYTEREAEIEAGVDLEETEEEEEEVAVEEEVVEEEKEEVVIEEEEEVVEEEEEEEEEETEVEEVEEEEEEEAGVYEIEINGKRYYTTSEQDGIVYEIDGEDDVGDEIGKFVNGKFKLNK